MGEIEKLMIARRRLLFALGIIFLLWQGGGLFKDFFPGGGTLRNIAEAMWAIGGLVWVALVIAMLFYQKRIKAAKAEKVLRDEYWQGIQSTALKTGYLVLIGSLALALGLDLFTEISASLMLRAILLIGVVFPVFHFVWLDRAGAGGN